MNIKDIRASMRQAKYPKVFRVAKSSMEYDELEMLERILVADQNYSEEKTRDVNREYGTEFLTSLADAGNWLWRTKNRVQIFEEEQPSCDPRRISAGLDSTWNAILSCGIRIQDHTGDLVIGKPSYKILAFEPSFNVIREEVIQTVKPSIYFREELIQRGEVIVGRPAKENSSLEEE